MSAPVPPSCACGETMQPIYNGTVLGCRHCDQRSCQGPRLCSYCRRSGATVK